MSKFFSIILFLVIVYTSKGQDSSKVIKKPLKWSQLIVYNGYASNHVTGMTALAFGSNSELTNANLSNSENLLFSTNRTGAMSGAKLIFSKGERDYSVAMTRYLGAQYSGDAFELIFRGNAQSAGETMDLKLRARRLEMMSVDAQIGNWGTKILSNKTALKLKQSVGVHLITRYADAQTYGGNDFFTSPSGLDLNANLNYEYINGNSFGIRGVGLSWGAYLYKRENWKIDVLKISNLGAAYISGGLNQFAKDSSWQYSGFDFNLGTGFDFGDAADSINNLLYNQEESDPRIILLPIHIEWTRQSKNYNLGAQYIAMPGYLPLLHAMKKGMTKKLNSYAYGLQAGGWGLLNTRLEYTHFFKREGNKIQLQMIGVESLLLPYPSFQVQLNYKL